MSVLNLNSPIVKMSLVLSLMACSLLALSSLFEPKIQGDSAIRQVRTAMARVIAIEASQAVESRSTDALEAVFSSLVERENTIRSIAIRQKNGFLVAGTSNHLFDEAPESDSSALENQMRIPMFSGDNLWGDLEVVFTANESEQKDARFSISFLWSVCFLAITGFASNLVFLRRALSDLDPNAVVPQRVHSALDVLAEGLVVIDEKENILLANSAFCKKVGRPSSYLLGMSLSSLDWPRSELSNEPPWYPVLAGETAESSSQMELVMPNKDIYTFAIRAVPVEGEENTIRGAIVTFDDLTDVERANGELRKTLDKLEDFQNDLERQNKELFVLATRDSLSNTLNRRAFFETFENIFNESVALQEELCCIMVDIDKFKAINDQFGHGAGDKVIRKVAEILSSTSRATDIVGRYGGEEFCLILPGTTLEKAIKISNNMREIIEVEAGVHVHPVSRITASFGVSSTAHHAVDPLDLCNQADRALYIAKRSGRNKVVGWLQATDRQTATAETVLMSVLPDEATLGTSKPLPLTDTVKLQERIAKLESELLKSEHARSRLRSRSLTNSLNSTGILHDRLEQSLVRGRRNLTNVAVMVIEFAAYRDVNAAFGIAYSERLIESVNQRLADNLRDTDTVSLTEERDSDLLLARSSDDSFVLILADLNDDNALVRIVARIEKSISRVFEIDGLEFYVSPRLGIALGPDDGEDAISLMASANVALDHAKRGAENEMVYRFFATEMNNFARRVLSLEAELHRAVEREEFVLHYQPRVDCSTGAIVGFEALVRWNHPVRGLLMPDSFISIAEKTGLILGIGDWVIETACRQLADWSLAGYVHLEMAINVSPIQMKSVRILESLKTQVAASNIDPHRVEIELTESVILGDIEQVVPLMQSIEAEGFSIALDDFGTGYSSLGYLDKLPLHRLKIDRSFLIDLGDSIADYTIISAIVEMAHALELRVVVEGIEEICQWEVLRELGCDELQGYLMSKPVDLHKATELLSEHPDTQLQQVRRKLGTRPVEKGNVAIRGVLNDAMNEDFSQAALMKKAG